MRRDGLFVLAWLLLPLTLRPGLALGDAPKVAPKMLEKVGPGQVDWVAKAIQVTGSGEVKQRGAQLAELRLKAERKARQDAVRKMLIALESLRIEVDKTGKALLKDPAKKVEIEGIVRGCAPVETRFYSGGAVDVSLRCMLDEGLSTVLTDPPDLPFKAQTPKSSDTGVILDASATRYRPNLMPRVYDPSGKLVYGPEVVDPNQLRQHGLVGFAPSVDAAKQSSRLGQKPRVLKVTADAKGLILDAASAAQLQDEGAAFLGQGRVVIVLRGS